jgi:hypothetical protein
MDYEAVLVKALAFLTWKIGERSCGSQIGEASGEGISRCAFPCHAGRYARPLSIKSFHGVWAGNGYECSLK